MMCCSPTATWTESASAPSSSATPSAESASSRSRIPAIYVRQQRVLSVYEEEAFEGIVLWDAAVLIESGGAKRMDKLVVVLTDPATELARLMARDGMGDEEARGRIATQMPVADKAKLADYVIDNSGTRAETERQVRQVYKQLLADLKTARAAGR